MSGFLINPYNYAQPLAGSFELIETLTASSNVSQFSFNSIPSTYQHLQVRGAVQQYRAASTNSNIYTIFRFNGSATSGIYNNHIMANNTVGAVIGTAYTYAYALDTYYVTSQPNPLFSGFVMDIYNYNDTNSWKTARSFSGFDSNELNSGRSSIWSSMWESTSAITSITLYPNVPVSSEIVFSTGSTISLYGVKAE